MNPLCATKFVSSEAGRPRGFTYTHCWLVYMDAVLEVNFPKGSARSTGQLFGSAYRQAEWHTLQFLQLTESPEISSGFGKLNRSLLTLWLMSSDSASFSSTQLEPMPLKTFPGLPTGGPWDVLLWYNRKAPVMPSTVRLPTPHIEALAYLRVSFKIDMIGRVESPEQHEKQGRVV